MPTECYETAEEPWTHAGKVILDIVRTGGIGLRILHTLDWKVKAVKPKKTPNVINLHGYVKTLPWRVGESPTYNAWRTIVLSKYAHSIPRVKDSRRVKVDRRTRLSGC